MHRKTKCAGESLFNWEAHRIGKCVEGKLRPSIFRFAQFKDKQRVLSAASKLKGIDFSLSEDFSKPIRTSRRKLIAFARERNAEFILRYDKLTMDGKAYIWDATSSTVRECDLSSRTTVVMQRDLSNEASVVVQAGNQQKPFPAASQSSRLRARASDPLSIIVVNCRSLENKST